MPKESKYVKEFLDIVEANVTSTGRRWYTSYDEDTIAKALMAMSSYKLGKIFSDNYWNYYPTWTSSKKVGRRDHYGSISSTVRFIRDFCPSLDKILLKKCEGAIAMACIDSIRGSDRITLSKRMINSKDIRVRRRVAGILPAKYLHKMINDKNYSVANKAIERIGIDNCAEHIIGSGGYYESEAIRASNMNAEQLMSRFESIVSDDKMYPYSKLSNAKAILQKMTNEQLLYSLGLLDNLCVSVNQDTYRIDLKKYVDKRLTFASR